MLEEGPCRPTNFVTLGFPWWTGWNNLLYQTGLSALSSWPGCSGVPFLSLGAHCPRKPGTDPPRLDAAGAPIFFARSAAALRCFFVLSFRCAIQVGNS